MPCPFGYTTKDGPRPGAPEKRATPAYRRAGAIVSHLTHGTQEIDREQLDSNHRIALPGPLEEDFVAYNTYNHNYITELHNKYGDTFKLIRDGQQVVFVRGAKEVRAVLHSEDFGKTWDSEVASGQTQVDYVMNLIQPMLKNTIFNKHGDENFDRRIALRPLFTAPKTFVPLVAPMIRDEIATWSEGVVDIQDLSHSLLRKNILGVMCGEFAAATYFTIPVFHTGMEHFVQRYANACHDQSVTAEDEVVMKSMYETSLEAVRTFKRLVAGSEPLEATQRSMLYLHMKAGYSEEESAATIVNVMIAAGEAPASALAQTLEELGRNPCVQTKLLDEVQGICEHGSLERGYIGMDYTEKVATEGLRLFAPATLVQRSAMEDTTLADVRIPKGTVVGVCVHSVHHNQADWGADASSFNPERPDLDYESHPAFVPFSKGQRGCPGKHVALAIVKISLASIVEAFEITVAPGQAPSAQCPKVPKMVEWSVDGIPVMLRRREAWVN